MKEYYTTDRDGKKKIIEQDNGITTITLIEPSPEYIAKMPPSIPEPEPRNYLAELDDLKAKVSALEKKVK